MTLSDEGRALLREVLESLYSGDHAFPKAQPFRLGHEALRPEIDELVRRGFLRNEHNRYVLTLEGLRVLGTEDAKRELAACNALLPALQAAYRAEPGKRWTVEELSQEVRRSPAELAKNLAFLRDEHAIWQSLGTADTGLVTSIGLSEGVLDVEPLETGHPLADDAAQDWVNEPWRMHRIEVSGYRAFDGFVTTPGRLTVIIGANAAGKTSLFDFLRFVSFAAQHHLPHEIDPASVGRTLFFVGGPPRIAWRLDLGPDEQAALRYEAELHGPVGAPQVTREKLVGTQPLAPETRPFTYFEFKSGTGVVREPHQPRLKRPVWKLDPNELGLRRALDPSLVTASRLQRYASSWGFYPGFHVGGDAPIRRPVPTEPAPVLAEDGSNLSAVLMWMMTTRRETWEELATHLRASIPGFRSLGVEPRGGPGTVIATWYEEGLQRPLTLADLSDGTILLLCWATLCLTAESRPLLCIDEPETGLHPRVLATLAGLFKLASSRTQILIATHSPYFLSHFALEDIAVMKKEDGRAVFARPASSAALRRELEALGPDGLAQMHISDELEVRS